MKYTGVRNGIATEGWIAQLEKMFNVMHIHDDGERVRLTSLCLTEQADSWWSTEKAARDVSSMTCIFFN